MSEPLRVLMLGWEFPPHISGGLGTACEGLAIALAEDDGVELTFVVPHLWGDEDAPGVTLLAPDGPPPAAVTEAAAPPPRAVEILRIPSPLAPYLDPEGYLERAAAAESDDAQPPRDVAHYGHDLFAEVERYARQAAALAATLEFDVIHAHDWMTFPAGMAVRANSGKPLVLHVHSTEYDRSGAHPQARIHAVEHAGLHAADAIVAVSHYTKNVIAREYEVPAEQITVIHNGIRHKERLRAFHASRPHRADKTVLFLGRVTMQKGPEYFIEAAREVIPRYPNVKFVIAGTGDMLPGLIERVAELGLSRYFHFTGFVKGEQLELMYSIADVYVMPSVSEPFGIAPLEALTRDTPVIISKQSGVSEVLKHALRVDFWDTERLAELILAVLHYPAIAQTMTELGTDELLELRWDASAAKLTQLYGDVVSAASEGS